MVSFFKNSALVFIAVATLCSCDIDEEIDFEYFGYKPQIIVNGYITHPHGAMVEVGRTVNPILLSYMSSDDSTQFNSEYFLADPAVWLVDSIGNRTQLTESEPGFFVSHSTFEPSIGMSYSIEVNAKGYGTVTTEWQTIPTPARIDSAKIITSNGTATVWVHLTDIDLNPSLYGFSRKIFYSGVDSLYLSGINDNSEFRFGLPNSDNDFEDNRYTYQRTFSIVHQWYDYEISEDKEAIADSVKVRVVSLNSNLIDFYSSLNNSSYLWDETYMELPPPVISNISGGVGFFSSFSESSVSFRIDEPNETE